MENDYLPDHIKDRIVFHGEEAPYHREKQKELAADNTVSINSYDELETWNDLREAFRYLDDDDLRSIDSWDLVPEEYRDEDLLRSPSSGTTGAPKEVFYHEDDAQATAEYVVEVLDKQGIVPTDSHWAATTTPNEPLQYMLTYTADAYNGDIDLVKVDDPGSIKGALRSDDPEKKAAALDPIADQVVDIFEENDVKVYEDIAPLMMYTGTKIDQEQRENVEVLLIGGVGTDQEMVNHLTTNVFPNADLSGWYGDYMAGFSMTQEPNQLEYAPQRPDIQLDVRDRDNLNEIVDVGDRGEVVAHVIREGCFVPNRRIGDAATRSQRNGIDTITNIGRLE